MRPEPMAVFGRIYRLARLVGDGQEKVYAGWGIGRGEFDVLAALRRSEPPHELSPAQLIESTHIGSPAMTHRLAKLVERGYVERRPHPYDGRSIIVRLTESGAARADAAMTELVRREESELAPLDRAERAQLVRLLRPLAADVRDARPADKEPVT